MDFSTYILTEFGETSTNSFRVLQELVSTLVNTTLLQEQLHVSLFPQKNPLWVHKLILASLPVKDLVVKSLAQSSKQRWTKLL